MVPSQSCVDAMLKIFNAIFGRGRQPITAATDRATEAPPRATATASDHARMRAPLRDVDLVLSRVAEVWLMALPRPLRPAALCSAYPRVVNRLALCWGDPVLTERLLDDLLVGRRGKRKGFPAPVAEELLRLRRFHDHHREDEAEKAVWEHRSPVPSVSSLELVRGLQVSEESIDTLPCELVDELLKHNAQAGVATTR
jgi:hypothetical protein